MMEVLRINHELISHHINLDDIIEILKYHNHINEFDICQISAGQDVYNSFGRLLTILEDDKNSSGIVKLHDIIRRSYPYLSANITDIQIGLRFKRVFGSYKIVKISLFDEELAVDIRKYMVS